ncbi:hypothetical protein CYY_002454 [Polysphondylium violaceum]|uniref:Uncharacterized protein n=1 Tax=Polysphondylium violaceum TaxID=133409 RepID=A0A8J4V2M2_9MYCE|nr:hypothetical protein CYY_002454 [Polysphondylium violaceum]
MFRSFISRVNSKTLTSTSEGVLLSKSGSSRMIGSGFYKTSEEMAKLKKQDLSDEQVNEIIRKAEHDKEVEHFNVVVTPEENHERNVYKANKKIGKMVPKDVEKFD